MRRLWRSLRRGWIAFACDWRGCVRTPATFSCWIRQPGAENFEQHVRDVEVCGRCGRTLEPAPPLHPMCRSLVVGPGLEIPLEEGSEVAGCELLPAGDRISTFEASSEVLERGRRPGPPARSPQRAIRVGETWCESVALFARIYDPAGREISGDTAAYDAWSGEALVYPTRDGRILVDERRGEFRMIRVEGCQISLREGAPESARPLFDLLKRDELARLARTRKRIQERRAWRSSR